MMKYIKGQINDDCLFIRNSHVYILFVTNMGRNHLGPSEWTRKLVRTELILTLYHEST